MTNESQIQELVEIAANNEHLVKAALCKKSFEFFVREFWDEQANDKLIWNWHMTVICQALEEVGHRVGKRLPRVYDLVINVPPGTSKTSIASILFPIWVWTTYPWVQFVTASYSGDLSKETAEKSRNIINSDKFKKYFPLLELNPDKSGKTNFQLVEHSFDKYGEYIGIKGRGTRFATSVKSTATGFHGHINIVDDPQNPKQADSDTERMTANHFVSKTLPSRKTDSVIGVLILIMQRLHQEDTTAFYMERNNCRHICLPGEIRTPEFKELVKPAELIDEYKDGLLDPVRYPWNVLMDRKASTGATGYAGQYGQRPTPPGGSLFKVNSFITTTTQPSDNQIEQTIRYWDKAATEGAGCFSAGVKMSKLKNGTYFIWDVKKGQWGVEKRENIILSTAKSDGVKVKIMVEQEPGSGGKESAEATIRMLSGYVADADAPKGDKVKRADPYATQVNWGNVILLYGDWNKDFKEEHEFFPFSTYKDQVDAAAAAFNNLNKKKTAGTW